MESAKRELPAHLKSLFEKRAAKFKELGCDKEPAEFLIECLNKANSTGNDNALIHAVIA